jgi:hypothetical protein
MMISNRKQTPTIATSEITSASSQRKPLFCRYRTRRTSSAVMATPQASGIPKRRLRAIAVPMTSARSQAAMAISQRTQSAKLTPGV